MMWYTCPLLKETQAVSNALDVLFFWGGGRLCQGMQDLSSLMRNQTCAPLTGSLEPQSLNCQAFPNAYILNNASVSILVQVALFP